MRREASMVTMLEYRPGGDDGLDYDLVDGVP